MKRLFLILGFVLCFFALHDRASATTCTVPNVFTNGTASDAVQVNTNFTSLQTCGNAIDFNNIGVNGLYASNLKPTTIAQASFGGTTVGYTFGGYATTSVPLTIFGVAAQSADIFDVFLTNGGTKEFWVDSAGVVHSLAAITGACGASACLTTAGNQTIVGAETFTGGLTANAAINGTTGVFSGAVSGTTGTFTGAVSGTTANFTGALTGTSGAFSGAVSGTTITGTGLVTGVGLTAGTGTVQASSNNNILSYVPAAYTPAGAAVTVTAHLIVGSVATGACANGSTCFTTFTLGSAATPNGNIYTNIACMVTEQTANGSAPGINDAHVQENQVGPGLQLVYTNNTGSSTTQTFTVGCISGQ